MLTLSIRTKVSPWYCRAGEAYQQARPCWTYAPLPSWPALSWWPIIKWNTLRRVSWDPLQNIRVQFSNCNFLCSEWWIGCPRYAAQAHSVNALVEKCRIAAWLCAGSWRRDQAWHKGPDTCPCHAIFFFCTSRKTIPVRLSWMVQEIRCLPGQGNRYVESQATHGRPSSTDDCNTSGLSFTRCTLITSVWWGDTSACWFSFFILIRCVWSILYQQICRQSDVWDLFLIA